VHRLAATNPVLLVWGTAAPGTAVSAGNLDGPGNRDTCPGAPR
jgi:hypothetical protein